MKSKDGSALAIGDVAALLRSNAYPANQEVHP
jgi:hypothetical protein